MLCKFKPTPVLLFIIFTSCFSTAHSQDSLPEAKHAAIIFPYPMYHEKWRSSIGFTLLTTPEDITEEVRLRIPTIDFRVLRKITSKLIAEEELTHRCYKISC